MTEVDVEVIIPMEDLIDAGIDPDDKRAVERFAKKVGSDALLSSRLDFSTSHPRFTAIVQEGGKWRITIEYDSGFQRGMVRDEEGNWMDGEGE